MSRITWFQLYYFTLLYFPFLLRWKIEIVDFIFIFHIHFISLGSKFILSILLCWEIVEFIFQTFHTSYSYSIFIHTFLLSIIPNLSLPFYFVERLLNSYFKFIIHIHIPTLNIHFISLGYKFILSILLCWEIEIVDFIFHIHIPYSYIHFISLGYKFIPSIFVCWEIVIISNSYSIFIPSSYM